MSSARRRKPVMSVTCQVDLMDLPSAKLVSLTEGFLTQACMLLYMFIQLHVQQAPVVQRADNFIHWIVRYPADKMCARFSR